VELIERFEYKYLIPIEDIADVRSAVERYLVPDDYARAAGGSYVVRSIYYDTPDLDCYHEKLAGIQHRRKVRIRGYGDTSERYPAFLEIKRRDNQLVSKTRAAVPFEILDGILNTGDIEGLLGERDVKTQDAVRAFLYHVRRYSMQPVLRVTYVREAYTATAGTPLRFTIDTNVCSIGHPSVGDLFSKNGDKVVFPGHVVLEVKFPLHMPTWLATLLDARGYEQQSVSKYVCGLEASSVVTREGEPGGEASTHRSSGAR
jgi:hypothetical protein